ncbi:unnamed protein product [Bursaphelenchus xylophilus]|uniref:(pine wood nematode) hypothetical protein n=1 Tax=Bursaphelenchus xylophilus TaxID=6326 RepID=A0A1I7SCT1_BURXY|nr:unnamed protein product [Bursaphelenchus xylophilus]CAG9093544.1 unnamed protein product [Bursaphelenchus xylophilus]
MEREAFCHIFYASRMQNGMFFATGSGLLLYALNCLQGLFFFTLAPFQPYSSPIPLVFPPLLRVHYCLSPASAHILHAHSVSHAGEARTKASGGGFGAVWRFPSLRMTAATKARAPFFFFVLPASRGPRPPTLPPPPHSLTQRASLCPSLTEKSARFAAASASAALGSPERRRWWRRRLNSEAFGLLRSPGKKRKEFPFSSPVCTAPQEFLLFLMPTTMGFELGLGHVWGGRRRRYRILCGNRGFRMDFGQNYGILGG